MKILSCQLLLYLIIGIITAQSQKQDRIAKPTSTQKPDKVVKQNLTLKQDKEAKPFLTRTNKPATDPLGPAELPEVDNNYADEYPDDVDKLIDELVEKHSDEAGKETEEDHTESEEVEDDAEREVDYEDENSIEERFVKHGEGEEEYEDVDDERHEPIEDDEDDEGYAARTEKPHSAEERRVSSVDEFEEELGVEDDEEYDEDHHIYPDARHGTRTRSGNVTSDHIQPKVLISKKFRPGGHDLDQNMLKELSNHVKDVSKGSDDDSAEKATNSSAFTISSTSSEASPDEDLKLQLKTSIHSKDKNKKKQQQALEARKARVFPRIHQERPPTTRRPRTTTRRPKTTTKRPTPKTTTKKPKTTTPRPRPRTTTTTTEEPDEEAIDVEESDDPRMRGSECDKVVKQEILKQCVWGETSYHVISEEAYTPKTFCCSASAVWDCFEKQQNKFSCHDDEDMKLFSNFHRKGYDYLDCDKILSSTDCTDTSGSATSTPARFVVGLPVLGQAARSLHLV